MNSPPVFPDKKVWQMPVIPDNYDRSPLTRDEIDALASAIQLGKKAKGSNGIQYAKPELLRFQAPLHAVVVLRDRHIGTYRALRRLIFREMLQRGTTFWAWSKEEWVTIICPTHEDYQRKYGSLGHRPSVINMAYLLGGIADLYEVGQHTESTRAAQSIFSADVVDQEFKRITNALVGYAGRGYSESQSSIWPLRQALCLLFLLNRSPYLEDLSGELLLTALRRHYPFLHPYLIRISTALDGLGLVERPKEEITLTNEDGFDVTGVPEGWAKWCMAWYWRNTALSPSCRRSQLGDLLTVGRWLAANHPNVVAPSQWDEDFALSYVSYICTATTGEYVSSMARKRLVERGLAGKPLTPRTIDHKLSGMRCFFVSLQDSPHAVDGRAAEKVEKRFNPIKTFATPAFIKRLIQPDPRDIDEVIWYKLTYAAATLTEEDYEGSKSHYPLSYYRATALLWVTSARRPNEITRLQLGCVRRDWDHAMLDEHEVPLQGQEAQLCYPYAPT